MELAEDENGGEAIFYYCGHQFTTENRMEVLEVDGDDLLIKLSGKTMDVNFYDGSKPENLLNVTAWFRPRQSKSTK